MTPSPALLSLDRIEVRRGDRQVLHGVSLSLRHGERLALLGPNGAGKTTLLRTALGLCPARSGHVHLAAERTGSLLEQPGIARQGRCLDYLAWHAALQGCPNPRRRAAELLAQWDLPDVLCASLSLGQRNRLQIARSLVHSPELLLLDEPAANLDPEGRHALHERLRAWNREGGSLLWATHDLEEAIAEATSIAVLSAGRLRWIGPAESFPLAFPSPLLATFERPCTPRELGSFPELAADPCGTSGRISPAGSPATTLRRLVEAGLPVATFGPDRHSLLACYRAALEAPPLEPGPRTAPTAVPPIATPRSRFAVLAATFDWERRNLGRELRFLVPFLFMQALMTALQLFTRQPSLAVFSLLPTSLAASLTADLVAGERERSGLDTLRASKAPLTAILLGKLSLAWAASLLTGLSFLVPVALFLNQPLLPWLGLLAGCTLAGTAFSARLSARARTVRAAAQFALLGAFVPGLGLFLASALRPDLGWLRWLPALSLAVLTLPLVPRAAQAWAKD